MAEHRHDAFAELYDRYFHELYDFAARITRDRTIAADIVQSVFATVWERAGSGDRVRSPRAWLYRLTHNAAVDELRRRRRTNVVHEDESFDFAAVKDLNAREPAQALIDKELAELVWSTAAAMRPEEYGLLDLYVRRELGPDELAEHLGTTPGAVHTRLSRLRRSFEDALAVTLLRRRGGMDCEALGALVAELGADAESEAGWRLLRRHVRECPDCRRARGRWVTASEILAGLAPVPLTPQVQGAVWSNLCELLGFAGAASAGGAAAAAHAAPSQGGHLSSVIGAAGANPVLAAAVVLAAVAMGVGGWAAVSTLRSSHPAAPHDPARFSSPAPGTVLASGRNRITISWTRLPDAVGYSILWSHRPGDEPDTVADLPGTATRTTSPALAPGTWYFHLRTRGQHDWTHTVHLGPFVIAPPTGTRTRPAPPAFRPPLGRTTPRSGATAPPGGPVAEGTSRGTTTVPALPEPDSTPPSEQTVTLAGGPYYRGRSVPLELKAGVDAGSGVDPASGVVERSDAPLVQGSCGAWGAWSTIAVHGSADTAVTDSRCYRYRYRISDRAGNESAPSRPSATAIVDTTPPATPTLAVTENGADTAAVGATLFYRPNGDGGSFTVAVRAHDNGSGLAAIEFPTLTGGMSGPAVTRRTAPPYQVDYRWIRGATAAGPMRVTAIDRAGNSTHAVFMLESDTAGPEGVSVALSGGIWHSGTSVSLLVGAGSDAGSGLSSDGLLVERDTAPLDHGTCVAFGDTWTRLALDAGADTAVADGACYRYRVTAADNVGNRTTSAPSEAARVDTTPPEAPTLTFQGSPASVHVSGTTVFYRPAADGSLTVVAASDDPQSGIAHVTFPALPGASGGGDDGSTPYEASYNWSALGAAGAQTVTASNGAGLGTSAVFTPVADTSGPTGVSAAAAASGAGIALTLDEGSDADSGVDPGSLLVERETTSSGIWTAVSLTDGKDTTVAPGTSYRYRVSVADNVGNRTMSAPSDPAVVDATPPSPPIPTLEALSGTYVAGGTVFYRPTSGSFTVAASSSDPESGIAEILFPLLPGASGGGSDPTAPFQASYAWTALPAPWPAIATLTARNGADLTADSMFWLTEDDAGPSLDLTVHRDGSSGHIRVGIEASDASSGVATTPPLIERDSAPQDGGTCGSFSGTWGPVMLDPEGLDRTTLSHTCYRYRVTVSDNVGNTTQSAPVDAG